MHRGCWGRERGFGKVDLSLSGGSQISRFCPVMDAPYSVYMTEN